MPVSVMCEAATAALRDSLVNSCSDKSSIMTNGMKDSIDNLQKKIMASTRRGLLSKIEYEEVNNYGQTVLENFKTKYIILKPNVNKGASSTSAASITPIASLSSSLTSSSSTPKSNGVNGNANGYDKKEQGELLGKGGTRGSGR